MANKTPPEKRDQQVGVMLTQSERDEVDAVARQLGMSRSNAGRYLIRLGLDLHKASPNLGE